MRKANTTFLGRLGKSVGRLFSYDNVTDTSKRKVRSISVKSEDDELTPSQRRQMITNGRSLIQNYPAAVWAVGTHVNSVCSLRFCSRNSIPSLDARITSLMNWWQRPENCHSAGLHSLATMVRMIESRAVVDGDIFLLRLQDGRLQPIESDRVASVATSNSGLDMGKFIHGIQVDDGGRRQNYCVCKRQNNSLKFERLIPAWQMFNYGWYERFDQVRGVSKLSAALNAYQDTAECVGYALAKMKVAQLIGLAHYSDDPIEEGDDDIDLSSGNPFFANAKLEEKIEWLESDTPGPAWHSFFTECLGLAFKTLFIPHCFYWAGSAYAESKLKRDLWYEFIKARREELRTLLNAITAWRIGLWIQDNYLTIPRGWSVSDLQWEWVGAPLPSINVLDDIRGQVEKIDAGLTSPQRAIKEFGDDPDTIKAENEAWNKSDAKEDETPDEATE